MNAQQNGSIVVMPMFPVAGTPPIPIGYCLCCQHNAPFNMVCPGGANCCGGPAARCPFCLIGGEVIV